MPENVYNKNRKNSDDNRSADQVPTRNIGAVEIIDGKRNRICGRTIEKIKREDEVVPCVHEIDQDAGHHDRPHQRKLDLQEKLPRGAAVQDCNLIEIARNRVDKAVKKENGKRQHQRRIQENNSREGILIKIISAAFSKTQLAKAFPNMPKVSGQNAKRGRRMILSYQMKKAVYMDKRRFFAWTFFPFAKRIA